LIPQNDIPHISGDTMQRIAFALCAALTALATPLAVSQQAPQQFAQLPAFHVGDPVDYNTFGRWLPCSVASPLSAGVYNLHCGAALELRAKADPYELRPRSGVIRVNLMAAAQPADATEAVRTAGARYGTREPRTCDNRKGQLTPDQARELLSCDAEHEFAESLYLVSDMSVNLGFARPFNQRLDAGLHGVDTAQPVADLHATFNTFQCRPIPADRDNPLDRNCSQFRQVDTVGSCFKNQAGDWHCQTVNMHPTGTATVTNVRPPTLVE
jgi:hypothetical protein